MHTQVCWEVNKALMSYPETYFLVRRRLASNTHTNTKLLICVC